MIDLSHDLKKALVETLARARKRYKAGEDTKAAADYEAASRLALKIAHHAPDRDGERKHKRDAMRFRDVAKRLASGQAPAKDKRNAGPGAKTPAQRTGGGAEAPDDDSDGLAGVVSQLVTASNVTWEQIGGLEETKHEIKYALALSVAKAPKDVQIKSFRNMLFYGPPGTGKTLLAAATSNALRQNAGSDSKAVFYNVKVSSLLSKYFGESPRLVSELYGQARDASPSVVFLDEFDALAGSRDSNDSGAERRILSTILAELDGLAEKGRDDIFVLTVAATNRPWDLDAAVLSRFEKKVLIPLPDPDSRAAIIDIHIMRRGFKTSVPMDELVAMTRGYSGREIDRFAKEVQNAMVAEMNADLPRLIDGGLDGLRGYELKVRALEHDDFARAAARITPQTDSNEMARFERWRDTMSV